MQAWNVTEEEIRTAAAENGLAIYGDFRGTGITPGAEDFEWKFSGTYGNGNDWNLGYGQACTCTDARRETWEYV